MSRLTAAGAPRTIKGAAKARREAIEGISKTWIAYCRSLKACWRTSWAMPKRMEVVQGRYRAARSDWRVCARSANDGR